MGLFVAFFLWQRDVSVTSQQHIYSLMSSIKIKSSQDSIFDQHFVKNVFKKVINKE